MKKGEIQLQESILVTFFVIVIIAIGLIVFYRFSLNSLDNYEDDYREQQLMSLLITLPNELGYTYLGDSQNAVDTSKLFYEGNYGFMKLVIEQTYPFQEKVECNMQNYPDCNYFAVYNKQNLNLKNKLIESKPVSLYFPLTDEYKLGKLIVEYYY